MKKAKRMRMLVKTLSAAVLGVLVGTASADMSGMGGPAIPRELKESMSNSFGGDVILCGDYDKARAEEDLKLEIADLIAFGRPFISNPDFVERLRNDWPLAAPDMETFYTPGGKGYTDYPAYSDS